jgi:hypothetical protein
MRIGTPKFQKQHGFRRGQPVARSGGLFTLATTATGFNGLVGTIYSADQFELVSSGELDNVPTLVMGGDNVVWYLSNTPGLLASSGTVAVGRVIGNKVLVQASSSVSSSVVNNITQGVAISNEMPSTVIYGMPSSVGSSEDATRGDHKHAFQPPSDAFTGDVVTILNIDSKTGLMQHVKMQYRDGFAVASVAGPWHPFMESQAADRLEIIPSAGNSPDADDLYHHVSSAATWAAGADSMLLVPSTLSPLAVVDNVPQTAIISVPGNASGSWYGCILPIEFTNTVASDTPRDWGVQFRAASSIPSGHLASIGITNKDNLESPWLLDLRTAGAVWSTKSEEDARVIGYGGKVVIFVYIGLGLPPGSEMRNPQNIAWSVTLDAWLI